MFTKYELIQYANTSAYSGLDFSVIGGTTWDYSSPITLTDIYDPKISRKLGNLNDQISFKIDNTNNRHINDFHIQDNVVAHLLFGSEVSSSSNQIFNGLLKVIGERVEEKGTYLNISGVSFDELVTNGLVVIDLLNVTAFEFLQAAVNSLQTYTKPNSNGQFYLDWDTGNPVSNKYNPSTGLYDGDALPKMLGGGRVSYFNKTLDQLLNMFLNDEYTGDGRYYWYVSNDKKLVIRKMLFNPTGTLIEGTDDIVSMNLTVDTNQIYNFILVQGGNSPSGRAISTYKYDAILGAQYGLKPFLLKTNDANTLAQQELSANPSAFISTSLYPQSYPHTCSWKLDDGSTVTASSDSDYNSKFREEVKRRGVKNAISFIATHSKGMRQIVIELPPTRDFHLGDIVSLTVASYNLTNFPIRIYQIDYGYDNVVLTFKEEYNYAI